jgi:hypothetical protein
MRLHEDRVAPGQVHHEEPDLPLDPAEDRHRFAEVGLRVARRMRRRNERLRPEPAGVGGDRPARPSGRRRGRARPGAARRSGEPYGAAREGSSRPRPEPARRSSHGRPASAGAPARRACLQAGPSAPDSSPPSRGRSQTVEPPPAGSSRPAAPPAGRARGAPSPTSPASASHPIHKPADGRASHRPPRTIPAANMPTYHSALLTCRARGRYPRRLPRLPAPGGCRSTVPR